MVSHEFSAYDCYYGHAAPPSATNAICQYSRDDLWDASRKLCEFCAVLSGLIITLLHNMISDSMITLLQYHNTMHVHK